MLCYYSDNVELAAFIVLPALLPGSRSKVELSTIIAKGYIHVCS